MKIGVLAAQGDFAEHIAVLKGLGVEALEVRRPQELEVATALIIPGGESTAIARLMDWYGLREPVVAMAQRGMPVWGTCAGMILMARELSPGHPRPLGLMDIDVVRNAFGRQVDSFEIDLRVQKLGEEPFPAVFIRAPVISRVGEEVDTLARLPDGRPVAVQCKNLLATAFHPELTRDTRFHRYFLGLAKGSD